jgi:hypothetical protein
MAVVYGLDLGINRLNTPLNTAENVSYAGLHRLAWGLALGWVILACCRGYGGCLKNYFINHNLY